MAAAGFARAVILNFAPTGEMREGSLVREAKGTAPAQWGAFEEQVRQSIVGRIQRRNAWTLQVAREHARLVPFIGIDPRMGRGQVAGRARDVCQGRDRPQNKCYRK